MNKLRQILPKLLASSVAQTLTESRRGIEKESLRISPNGKLAQTPHPVSLGSALTHPYITTDFSEALLEFITPPCKSISEALQWLENIHSFVYEHINKNNEMLWAASMPCILEGNDYIPIAKYGSSNIAKMKHVYRLGLSHRYGRVMQTISGIHYNFSLPDSFWNLLKQQEKSNEDLQTFKTRRYFDLIRNFQRNFWLLLYLFGAAPAVCKTFIQGRKHDLLSFADHSLYQPYATSLRMGNLGYQSEAQAALHVDYNSLKGYLGSLLKALTTVNPEYEKIGICNDSQYKQLNANILQIENEFYSTIRPKRITNSEETPIRALYERGVEYIEVRSIDVNPFLPLGIDYEQSCFIELFLLYCLLKESPATDEEEYQQIYWNQHQVVVSGRDPQQEIFSEGKKVNLRNCAKDVLVEMEQLAPVFSEMPDAQNYLNSIDKQLEKISDANLTPAGAILELMTERKSSFYHFAMDQSQKYYQEYKKKSLEPKLETLFSNTAKNSVLKQEQIEAGDNCDFAEYLEHYYQQYCEVAHKL